MEGFPSIRLRRGVIVGVLAAACCVSSSAAAATHESLRPGDRVSRSGIGVVVPKPGHGVAAWALTTNGDVGLRVWTTRSGAVHVARYKPAAEPQLVPSVAGDPCSDTFEPNYSGFKWTSNYLWYFNSGSTPSGNNADNVETDLRAATTHITQENNNCGRGDSVSATHSYGGRNSMSVNIDTSAHCTSSDGTNETGFGTLPSGTIALTCTWFSGSTANESDMRMNKDSFNWITDEGSGCQTAMNVDDIATHERGHTFGMDDEYNSSHDEMTMYGYSNSCETKKETLSLGDMLRLESIY